MTIDPINSALDSLKKLLLTMKTLRSPDGCDWDRQQNPDSLKKYIIEEAYEVIDAIDRGDTEEICEELGDLLLQVVFQAQIFQEQNLFGMAEIADSIDTKLQRRHPHIFASSSPENSEFDWERIKREERSAKGLSLQLESRIPQALPALKRAEKLASTLARNVERSESVEATCQQIMESLPRIMQPATSRQVTEQEIGNILYNLTALARSLDIDAEDALRQSVNRRIKTYDKSTDGCPDRL